MSLDIEFKPWPKIPRYNRGILITEKIDGTNAQIRFVSDERPHLDGEVGEPFRSSDGRHLVHTFVGSRKRWIRPGDDNYGFAGWVEPRREELCEALGMGGHYGEWYGVGVQRGYGLVERRLALFNVDKAEAVADLDNVEVVPTLWRGDWIDPNSMVNILREDGSLAVPGYMQPEGVVVYHYAARQGFKILLEGDEVPKGVME